jgi:hypothetical protein
MAKGVQVGHLGGTAHLRASPQEDTPGPGPTI